MPSKPTKPTNQISWKEFYKKTDNGNKLMDRVWYCIAATEKDIGNQKIFWEHWYWEEGEVEKDLATSTKKGSNHTLTVSTEEKEVDYPIWPLTFTTDSYKMYPAIDLKCTVIAPIGLSMQPVTFPADDSRTEFRVDYCEFLGSTMYFIFTLDPHISEEDKKKNFETLASENGVLREWFHEVQWDSNYEIGSTGEPDINPK
jgi:hypothetical protein